MSVSSGSVDKAAVKLEMVTPPWLSDATVMARFATKDTPWSHSSATVLNNSVTNSQDGEDMHAYENYFFGRGDGSFIEMGALDGLRLTNTLALEALGWKGVHIEASPSSYAGLARNRPLQVDIHAAVCDKARMVHYVDEGNDCCRGIAEFMTDLFKKHFHPEVWKNGYAGLPEVQCLPLSLILDQLGMAHFNMFVLDVEGGELAVVQSIDFSRHSFDVIIIEADGSDKQKEANLIQLLASKGYKYTGHVLRNDWFVREGFVPSSRQSPAQSSTGTQCYCAGKGQMWVVRCMLHTTATR